MPSFARSRELLWEAWNLAKAYHQLPSVIYHIEDPVECFTFDRAVYEFGSFVAAKLEEVEGKDKKEIERKRLRVIQKYFPKAQASSASQFSDPAKRSN